MHVSSKTRMQLGSFLVKELFEKAVTEKDTPEQQETLAKAKYDF